MKRLILSSLCALLIVVGAGWLMTTPAMAQQTPNLTES